MKKSIIFYSMLFLLLSKVSFAQIEKTIPLIFDTSGYDKKEADVTSRMLSDSFHDPINSNANDTIPSIKSEMTVSDGGALTYMVPIEVLKGLNNFQPNLALGYNSQSGMGKAGWGWNIVGLSTITRGGKSKLIDGITQGPQYDGTDPYYLDGQRLLDNGNNTYVTEKYSKIIITNFSTGAMSDSFSFVVQYTDGKIAKYKELVSGQHYISVLIDAFGNEIHYDYSVNFNVPLINTISYGGTSLNDDIFKVQFIYATSLSFSKSYRNGILYTNTKVLKEIKVASNYIQANEGLFRRYTLTFDGIQNNTLERLIRIDLENENNLYLKPLRFAYNNANAGQIYPTSTSNTGFPLNTTNLGNIAIGDFYGTGSQVPIYETKDTNDKYNLKTPNGIIDSYYNTKEYFTGRSLQNNKISENDQLITIKSDYLGSVSDIVDPNLLDQLTFTVKDLNNSYVKNIKITIQGGTYDYDYYSDGYDYSHLDNYRDLGNRLYINGDFNNDGLTDFIIIQGSDLSRPQKIFFLEVGLLSDGNATPLILNAPDIDFNCKIYQIEYDGDGIPELMFVNKETGIYSVYKVNLITNSLVPLITNQELSNYNYKTPLIFGDFNGDGLTDFVTPQKLYDIKNSSASEEIQKMETETLLWWQYIGTGNGYIKTQQDFTWQKIAYLVPSQRNVIKKNSDWDNFWSFSPDSYEYTEYGTTTIMALDINNDGRSDLVSFVKFGTIHPGNDNTLNSISVNNLNNLSYTTSGTPIWHNPTCVNPWTGSTRTVTEYGNCYYNEIPYQGYWEQTISSPLSSTIANKVHFYLNLVDGDGIQNYTPLTTTIPLDNITISPYSLILNNVDYTKYNTYKTEIYIHDPILKSDRRFIINNDNFVEGQISSVFNGGYIGQTIEYKPMVEKYNDDNDRFYETSDLGLNYPYYIHKNIGTNYLVSKMHTSFDGNVLTQEYRYRNGIQHLNGKGFLGFQQIMTSDTYESKYLNGKYVVKDIFKALFWHTKTNDPLMDNALQETRYGSLNPNSYFTKSTITNQRFLKGTNRYLVLSTIEKNEDILNGITITKNYQYDTNGDLLLQQQNTDYNNQASTNEKFYYDTETTNGDHFFFGKINKVEKTSIRDGMVFTSSTETGYNSNGTVDHTTKYGITDAAGIVSAVDPITTTYIYHPFGEVNTETVSSNGMTDLTTTYIYDPTNRYINKVISPDNLTKIINVNPIGRVLSEVSPLGLTTTYNYDAWGNVKEVTDFLNNKTRITRGFDTSMPAGTYTLTKTQDGGTTTVSYFDKFDRNVKTKTQTLGGQWVYSETIYDVFGKKVQTSEPYFDGDPVLWNTIDYDDLKRPVKQTSFNGKQITTCYEKLKVTVDDNFKKTSKWLDATGNTVKHRDGGGDIIYKYYPNGSLKETDYQGIKTTVKIDGWGNKRQLIDPSAGTYTYKYDNFNRLLLETNPNGTTTYTYDNYGKVTSENTNGLNTAISKTYTYDSTTQLPTTITGTYNGNSYTYITNYNDPYHRITGKEEHTPYFDYQTLITYDSNGRPEKTTLQTKFNGFTTTSYVQNVYDHGAVVKQIDPANNNKTIWETNSINSHGLTTQTTFGNGFVASTTYNANTLSLERIRHQKGGVDLVNIGYSYDVQRGVLMQRTNDVFGKKEQYSYDDLDRLTQEQIFAFQPQQQQTLVLQEQKDYTYDQRGRMTSNTDVGNYNYNNTNYQLDSVNYNTNGSQLNTNRGFATISYNTFKNPFQITLAGKDIIDYDYSILHIRSKSTFGNTSANPANTPKQKFYSSDKAIEIVKETLANGNVVTKIITYVTGDPYSANYIKIDNLLNGSALTPADHYYLHRDNQGTIIGISKDDATGTVIEKRYFDAWGNLKAAYIGNNTIPVPITAMGWANGLLLDRGYTGHEHLYTVGLIHMNGRLYDPKLRRFLSVDNYVQDPYNTQNYNRYGYVLNNPLLYTDPSGELFGIDDAIIIAVAVAVLANGINNSINSIPFWYGAGKAAVMGAVSSAISFGIGAAQASLFCTQTATMTAKEACLSAFGNIFASFMPKWNIKMWDWSIKINPVLYFGKSCGIGMSAELSYTSGDFNFSYGFEASAFGKYYNTNKTGGQFRNSFKAGFDNGTYGFSLGTNIWNGCGGLETFNQRTGAIGLHAGDFRALYENDGGYGIKNLRLGDRGDSYRTAALNLSVGDFHAGFNLMTGKRLMSRPEDYDEYSKITPTPLDQFNRKYPRGFVDEIDTKYRLGALSIGYGNFNFGVDSEHVRHAIQDKFIHGLISDAGFENQSWNWNPYFQYKTANTFSSW